jgi:hypothetical protein
LNIEKKTLIGDVKDYCDEVIFYFKSDIGTISTIAKEDGFSESNSRVMYFKSHIAPVTGKSIGPMILKVDTAFRLFENDVFWIIREALDRYCVPV